MEAIARAYRHVASRNSRDQLIVDHLEFVRHVLGRIVSGLPKGIDCENLEAAGVLGLVEAAGQFDAARGVAFKTYSFPRIRGAILDELRRNCPLPQQMLQRWSVIRRAAGGTTSLPDSEILAQRTGLSIDEIDECMEAIRLTRPESWREEMSSGGVYHRVDPAEGIEKADQSRLLADAIEQLPRTDRLVVSMYHLDDMRLKEIGEVLNLSESRVSRILSRAEQRLRDSMRRREVRRLA
ncbi:RNA polymerase sigma factor FliA [Caulifigura coniformis]|uniref:RNA polymerase sigma factor FliA n=1 Tax=Caulifigura coniformis TaxID=2527983 RepID=A0A517SJB6_9PLAN|nr:sigma-70 family RNA polymerase sigma factor [Caulifigura coniformis]QDT56220.1 RNA polymerase sigma factor FliA [Caulifigura coniformis]